MPRSRARALIPAACAAALLLGAGAARAQPAPPSAPDPSPRSAARAPFLGAAAAAPALSRVRGGVPLVFARRPAADGSGRVLPARVEAPLTIRFASPPSAADLAALRGLGATVPLRRDGRPRGGARFVAASAPASAIAAIAALPGVERVSLDGSPFSAPRPLDGTTREIQASDLWATRAAGGAALSGHGITLCDVDSGIDVFHPLFFRADGGWFDWIDLDQDGVFAPGIDGVDADGDGAAEILGVMNSAITTFWSGEPVLGSEDPAFLAGMDWLFADANGSGAREHGRAAGFDDASPSFGERLFSVDDVDGDGKLDVGEKLVGLGTSKVRALRRDKEVYRRGEDLIDAPVHPDIDHGTGSAGVMVGGNRGLGRLVGVAPDAELVCASDTEGGHLVAMNDFCLEEGARVVLHEYAPWTGYHLDGSSDLEQLIDETVALGVSHVNPAGNLSGSQKLYKRVIPAGVETVVDVLADERSPYAPFYYIGVTLLWREPGRDLAVTLEDPTGASQALNLGAGFHYEPFHDGLVVYAERDDSSRGTAKVDIYVFGSEETDPPPIPPGGWKVRVTDPAPPGSPGLELFAYTADDRSGWGKGIHFPDFSSEDHLIGWPGTADHGVAVAAYTGHGWFGDAAGERAGYSGRGRRIDGQAILSIAAPDDPITAGYREGQPAVYYIYGGTSGASPHVAGAAALLVQADPSRTGDDVRARIREGALADAAVGAAPNEDFGYGKLRVHQSVHGAPPPGGAPPVIAIPPVTVPAGATAEIAIVASDAEDPAAALRLELDREYDGTYDEALPGPSFTVQLDRTGTYRAKVRVTDSSGKEAAALAVIEVVDELKQDEIVPRFLEAGGGACAIAPAGASSERAPSRGLPGWALAAVAALSLRRRGGPRRPPARPRTSAGASGDPRRAGWRRAACSPRRA